MKYIPERYHTLFHREPRTLWKFTSIQYQISLKFVISDLTPLLRSTGQTDPEGCRWVCIDIYSRQLRGSVNSSFRMIPTRRSVVSRFKKRTFIDNSGFQHMKCIFPRSLYYKTAGRHEGIILMHGPTSCTVSSHIHSTNRKCFETCIHFGCHRLRSSTFIAYGTP